MTANVKTRYTKTGDRKQKTATDKSPSGPSIERGGRKYYTGTKNIRTSGLTDKQALKVPYFWRHHWGVLKGWQRKNIVNAVVDGKSSKAIDKSAVRKNPEGLLSTK